MHIIIMIEIVFKKAFKGTDHNYSNEITNIC